MLTLRKTRYQIILITVVVLGIFSPALFGGYCPIDDLDMVNSYKNVTEFSLKSVFVPNMSGGLYYRPLIGLSFLLDHFLFDLDPFILHLHNVMLHLCNALLLFFIARTALKYLGEEVAGSTLPVVISLLFALHPIVTESVNWISGRTDILAGNFILLGTLLSLRFLLGMGRLNLYFALVFVLCAILTKETSLAFVPCIFLLIISRNGTVRNSTSLISDSRRFIYLIGSGLSVIAVFFLLRTAAVSSNSSRIGMTAKFILTDPWHYLVLFMRTFGFYLKKLVMPYPSNFSILEVDPLYELLAIPLLIVSIYIATRRTLQSAFFVTAILLFSPSFVIATNQIAWTPFAERYLYMSTAFFVLSIASYCISSNCFKVTYVRIGLPLLVLILMFGFTLERNFVWSSPLSLCEDTVKKSPDSKDMRLLYGSLLAEKGDYAAALQQLWLARAIPSLGYDERPDVNISYIYEKTGKADKAIGLMRSAVEKSKRRSPSCLEGLVGLLVSKLKDSQNPDDRIRLAREIMELHYDLYKLDHDPMHFHQMGLVAHSVGLKHEARQIMAQALLKYPVGTPGYSKIAAELSKVEKL